METKLCSKCKLDKSIIEFSKDKNRVDGHRVYCKICYSNYHKLRGKKDDDDNEEATNH